MRGASVESGKEREREEERMEEEEKREEKRTRFLRDDFSEDMTAESS